MTKPEARRIIYSFARICCYDRDMSQKDWNHVILSPWINIPLNVEVAFDLVPEVWVHAGQLVWSGF